MKNITLICVSTLLTACHSGEIAALRSEVERQREDINSLTAYVDAQARTLQLCQVALSDLVEMAVDKSMLGTLRGAKAQWARTAECKEAAEQFVAISAQRSRPIPVMTPIER